MTCLARRGRPTHPRELLEHDCLGWRFTNGPLRAWEFERNGEKLQIEPKGPLVAGFGGATDFAVEAAVAGCGLIYLFEDWLRPFIDQGALVPVLQPWWLRFTGPFLYYPGRRYLPTPLRVFVDFIKTSSPAAQPRARRGSRLSSIHQGSG